MSEHPPSDENALETAPGLAEGTVIAERYRVHSRLGESSTATTYLGEHLRLKKKVTIKVLNVEFADHQGAVARFEREAEVNSRLDNPHLAAAVDFGQLEGGAMYLVLEHVEGRSLRSLLDAAPLALDQALHIAQQIAEALEAVHLLGIVHRDLRPENVMLVTRDGDEDWVKVLDFGVARSLVAEESSESERYLTRAGTVFGHPEYIAPEQAIGQRVDARADLYALGVILFEMLAGVRPYEDDGQVALVARQLTGGVPTFAERAPHVAVPARVERLVARLLAASPEARFQQVNQVLAAFQELARGDSLAPEPLQTPLPSFELEAHLDLPRFAETEPLEEPPLPPPPPSAASEAARLAMERVVTWAAELWVKIRAQAKKGWKASLPVAEHGWQATCRFVEKLRGRLPAKWRRYHERITTQNLTLAVLGVVLSVLVALIGTVMCATQGPAVTPVPSTLTAAPSAAPSTAPAPLPPASAVTVAPVSSHSEDDSSPILSRASQSVTNNNPAEAVALVTDILGRRPELRRDERVLRILYQTAQSPDRAAVDATFSLLQGVMASNGADVLYRLALDRSIATALRNRTEKVVRSARFDQSASADVKTALALRRAEGCEKKRSLLEAAAKVGGPFVLETLRTLTETTGCGVSGSDDCYPCLRRDTALTDAVVRIENRTSFGGSPPAAGSSAEH